MKHGETDSYWGGIIKSMGLVFGDIGTSPIYTLTVIIALTKPTQDNILGIISLIVWTLIILVHLEYAVLAMSLSRKGEGGEIVLREILVRMIKPGRQMAFVTFLTYLGVALLMGDGVITPAISILSAVEGTLLIPGLGGLSQNTLILIAGTIALFLFVFQYKGTDKVARAFGPIMVLWFAALALSGAISVSSHPGILAAISPHHAISFLMHNGLPGFFVLSEVILCATGGEALYADMGHLGRKPVKRAWYFVFVALVINYLGQGAFIITHPDAKNILFGMLQYQAPLFYIPFLILTILATIIASQALISGVFSIVYQGINTRMLPLLKVDYTSNQLKSQIYIGSVNWLLLCLVILIMLVFRKSANLAAAYGFAVTGTMVITGIMMTMIFSRTTKKWKVPLALFVTLVDVVFLVSNCNKLPHGGYWSLILASVPLAVILIWTRGQRGLYLALRPLDLETYLLSYEQIYKKGRIAGTGLFFVKEWNIIPPYLVHCTIRSNIVYERNVLISIVRTDEPFGVESVLECGIGTGLDGFMIKAGYMEIFDIELLLKQNGIQEKVIFYGIEDIATTNPIWRVFSVIKKLTPNFVQFNKVPAAKLQGVITRVEM
ncbi:KUP/HAK/KT family potassium transporter [Pelobacter propionicus]|uniref:Probable potassium transport system protein Kup n=1 Tax=Pelobacter propionicus (strain DSM 2379 / NBRC 103807 / OttBd1) TaxID=338966 RepID=KUP_PELPD|nr:KUP/HAK/KT family potassium transporter [Pelobacter propionicus]A1ALM1.1 RecName: Full=Probable potassium transport system protein Kup [Pelobacter propionicus DSM 2379]ABK98241.1 potassium transporter [Pelobacter propionicus DSM 2379]